MPKFLTSNELNHEIEKLFEDAEEQIVLISPYIKLHERYISVLKTKKETPKLKITVVFGKNETDLSRSMKVEDFEFLKDFPNIEIRYEPRLHAKYYSNESAAILTSMNLYNFSQDNNIEFGVQATGSFLGELASIIQEDSFDSQAATYFKRVITQSEILFCAVPEYEKGILGITKKYKSSPITIDKLSDFFQKKLNGNSVKLRQPVKEQIVAGQSNATLSTAFCIRTGKPVPFNLAKPMTDDAFHSWSKYKDELYKEKFCHFSGEPSEGLTSFKKPILSKNYRKARETFNFS